MYNKKYFAISILLFIVIIAVTIGLIIHNHKKHTPTLKSRNISSGVGTNYSPSKSPSGHDCTKSSATQVCQNPGYGICTSSSCSPVDNKTCFSDLDFCQSMNSCDKDNGWERNSDNTDCNIYKCTYDGKLFDPSIYWNSADDVYEYTTDINSDYLGAFCWRKNIGTPEPDIAQYCTGSLGNCTGKPHDVWGDRWGNFDCSSYNLDCVPSLEDISDIAPETSGAPTYMYPSNEMNGITHTTCWRNNPTNRYIHFRTAGSSYPAKGDKNTDGCFYP